MKKFALLLAATAQLACICTPAFAAEPDAAAAADGGATGGSGDVVVTAPRREDQARDVKKECMCG